MVKKTTVNIKSAIRSALRRTWMYYCPNRKTALATSKVGYGKYQCQKCKDIVGPKFIDIDHIVKVTPKGGLNNGADYGTFIHNLFFCGIEGLVALCKPCHAIKTKEEKLDVQLTKKKTKKRKAKGTKRVRLSRAKRV